MQIIIANPYPLDTSNGNTITAKRIQSLLESLNLPTTILNTNSPPKADILINLHATRTYPAAKFFKTNYPHSKLITIITGTDLNQDLPQNHPDILPALELADSIILPHTQALNTLPKKFHPKAHIIPASIISPDLTDTKPTPLTTPYLVLPSHLRQVKNPFLINRALELLPDLNIQIYTLGAALEPGYAEKAKQLETQDPRFHYLGTTPHPETLIHIKNASLTLNTSHQEGGPNAIAESITLGTPVLASAVTGNIGMLGEHYPGLFTPDSPQNLASLIKKFLTNTSFKNHLLTETTKITHKFDPTQETLEWKNLITKLTTSSP